MGSVPSSTTQPAQQATETTASAAVVRVQPNRSMDSRVAPASAPRTDQKPHRPPQQKPGNLVADEGYPRTLQASL